MVSVEDDFYNLTKYDRTQITDATITKYPKLGGYLLEQLNIKCNDKNSSRKKTKFVLSTKPSSFNPISGVANQLAIRNSFVQIETNANYSGQNLCCAFERTDFVQISNRRFYFTRFPF